MKYRLLHPAVQCRIYDRREGGGGKEFFLRGVRVTFLIKSRFLIKYTGIIQYYGVTLVNRTYGGDKNPYIHLFLLTTFGPIYYRPP